MKRSTIAAMAAAVFFLSSFCLSLATPQIYYYGMYGGLLLSSIAAVYLWWQEKRTASIGRTAALLIVGLVTVLAILAWIVLPSL